MVEQSRRQFIKSALMTSGAPLVMGLPWKSTEKISGDKPHPVCIFSKHLQWLGFEDVGKFVKDLGFDGVDLTVRRGGHVDPESVEKLLPEAVEKITRSGVIVPMMATNIGDAGDPLTEKVLKTASENGITHYRMDYYDYDRQKDVKTQLEQLRGKVQQLAHLNENYRIKGAYQNHDGTHVGASIWDIWYVLKEIDPAWTGLQFDIRHAVVEGGRSWENDLRLVHDLIHCSVVKDFIWEKNQDNMWYVKNVPVGEGMVEFGKYFQLYKELKLSGPISLHVEYPIFNRDEENSSLAQKLKIAERVLSADLEAVRRHLTTAGISG